MLYPCWNFFLQKEWWSVKKKQKGELKSGEKLAENESPWNEYFYI